jgi:hypothetical protein
MWTTEHAAVAELVDRCRRITVGEAEWLAGAWVSVEEDPAVLAKIQDGERLAQEAGSDVDRAASEADWAFREALGYPGDGAIYADTDPIHGRAIRAIRAHAIAVAAHGAIPPELAAAMSRPWYEAIDTDPGRG